MLIVSTSFKQKLLAGVSFPGMFNGGQIRLFGSARPQRADMAETSAPIAIIERVGAPSSSLQFTLAADFVIKPPSDVWRLRALQPGSVAWWRLVGPGDTAADSLSDPRIDGDVAATGGVGDLLLTTTAFNASDVLAIDSFLFTFPPLAA